MLCAMTPLPFGHARLATPQDVPRLAALYAETARRHGAWCYSPEQVNAWAGFGADTPDFRDYLLGARTWVAEHDGRPLGFCGIDADGEVRSLYVQADHLRRGLGSALLAHALQQARAHGLEHFEAWATPFSVPVFRRAGFRLQRTVEQAWKGVVFERYRMVLDR